MSVLLYLQAALYGILAIGALRVAKAERRTGHKKVSNYHQMTALAYALLGGLHLLGA